jgi:hypothetical protein
MIMEAKVAAKEKAAGARGKDGEVKVKVEVKEGVKVGTVMISCTKVKEGVSII